MCIFSHTYIYFLYVNLDFFLQCTQILAYIFILNCILNNIQESESYLNIDFYVCNLLKNFL